MKYILFVCRDNVVLSQIAEAVVRLHRSEDIKAFSAGYQDRSRLSPLVKEALMQIGYQDFHLHSVKNISQVPDFRFDYVVCINSLDSFPDVTFERKIEWRINFTDSNSLEEVCRARDQILNKVLNLVLAIAA